MAAEMAARGLVVDRWQIELFFKALAPIGFAAQRGAAHARAVDGKVNPRLVIASRRADHSMLDVVEAHRVPQQGNEIFLPG